MHNVEEERSYNIGTPDFLLLEDKVDDNVYWQIKYILKLKDKFTLFST